MTKTISEARIGNPATLDTLRVAKAAVGAPGPGEILVRIFASSLNFHDYAVVNGMAVRAPGVVPMSDGAGVVEAVGEGVRNFRIGDAVVSLFFPHWEDGEIDAEKMAIVPGDTEDGFAADYVVRPASWFTRVPTGFTPAESATLPCAAVTAWRALMVEATIRPGSWVLTMGTGGVSIFALQFAKAAGAYVVATSSSDSKLERLKQLGADHVVNYRTSPEWGAMVGEIAGSGGVDVVVEIGGAGTLGQSIAATRIGGHIAMIGVLAGFNGKVATGAIMARNIKLHGITVGSRKNQLDMISAIEATGIRPQIGERFPLEDIARAFRHQASGAHFGKIVLEI